MAADQRKKRLNPSSVVGRSSREQCKVKKKKLDLPRYDLKMKSNISLEWDDKKKCVVSKREQIGISRRDLIPYVDPVTTTMLADVLDVPQEIFDISILKEIVSSEVWQTCLSEKERKLLAQFLPKGGDAYEVVQELLSGNNFHFGNPFLKWGMKLCSGNFHPDVVLQRELSFKANKRAYYSEFQKYHNDMIGNLKMWKERWVRCKDPEKEIVQKMWRSRKAADRSMLIPANESRPHDTNDQNVATSDSCSWAADEKACGSDNLALMMLNGESKRRNDFMEGKYDNSSDGLNVIARPREGEKLCKRNIQRGDGTRYMSYIKVSKEQHQRVMSSMKSSGNSIQSRSLNHVLGNLDNFHVQPYEAFEEEVRMKLHEHWLQLANKHLPAGLANWRRRQLEKQQLMKSLGQEIHEKVASIKEDEEEDNLHNKISVQANSGKLDTEPSSATTEFPVSCQEKEEEKSDELLQEHVDNSEANQEIESEDEDDNEDEDEEEESPDCVFEDGRTNVTRNYGPSMEDQNASVPVSPQNQQQHLQPIAFSPEFQPLVLDSNDNVVIAKTDNFASSGPGYSNMSHMDVTVHQRDHRHHRHHLSSASDVWPSVTMPFYHSTCVSNEYAPAPSELSLGNSSVVVAHQPIPLMDLGTELQVEEDNTRKLIHRPSEDGSFFNPYPNPDRHELLQSLFKVQGGGLHYHHDQKVMSLDFHPSGNVLMGQGQTGLGQMGQGQTGLGQIGQGQTGLGQTGQFPPVHFRNEPILPSISLELKQKRLSEIYMHQNIQDNMYPDLGRYSVLRQEQQNFTPLNIQDWGPVNPVNNTHISAPPASHLNGGETASQNWFYGENRSRSVWTGSEIGSNPSVVGNGNSNADQNLFSVISQCNELGPSATYNPMGPTERLIQPSNYGVVGAGQATNVVLPRRTNPLNFLGGGHETGSVLKLNNNNNNNLGWVNLPNQTTALQDSMGKTFLRPWNH